MLQKKKQKRENIAKSCLELFSKYGYTHVTVSKIADTAGIGKGTIYEYFANKEDIVLELMESLQDEYDKKLIELTSNSNVSYKEFLYSLFDIFIDKQNIHEQKREILKQFLIATITNPSDAIKEYNHTLREKYVKMINSRINNREIACNLYNTILSQYLLSLTLDIQLNQIVTSIIDENIKVLDV